MFNPGDIEVRFYGPKQNWLRNDIIKHNLVGIVEQCGVISRNESWEKQRESHVLLLLNWEDPKEKGVYTLKLFEYLAAWRPIMASGGFYGSDIEKLLKETKTGVYVPTAEEIEASLLSFYEEYERTGRVCYKGNLKEINKYSYREMASKFADILNQVTGK